MLVTGATDGIGRETALELARRGARVVVHGRSEERLQATIEALRNIESANASNPLDPLLMDLSRLDEVRTAGQTLSNRGVRVDVIVNNAGVQHIEPAELAVPEEGEKLLRLNVFTPLRIVRALLPGMLARKSGTIVDIASMCAITPMPGMYYYNASKGALACASEGLRGELRGTGIHIVTVYPGPVATDMGTTGLAKYESTWASRLSPMGNAHDLAKLVIRAVEKKKARVVYPHSLASAMMFPRLARWITAMATPPVKR